MTLKTMVHVLTLLPVHTLLLPYVLPYTVFDTAIGLSAPLMLF